MAYLLEFTGKVRVYSGFLVTSLGIERNILGTFISKQREMRENCAKMIL